MIRSSSLRAALLSSCALLTPGLAQAQAAPESQTRLAPVVIEAKRDVETQTPVALTRLDQAEIDDRQAATIAELLASVPGVTLINGNTPLGSGISIRGFGGGNTYGANQKVLITVDGASQGSEELYRIGTQLMTDPELYRSVSVLRGTAGSFEYGSGVVGGIVQLETKDASDFTGGVPGFRLRQGLSFGSNGDGITSSTLLAWQPSEDLEFLGSYVWRRQGEQVDGDGVPLGAEGFKTPSYLVKGKYTFGAARDHSVTLSFAHTELAERDVPYDAISDLPWFGRVDRDVTSRTTALSYAWKPVDNDLIDLSVALSRANQRIDQVGVPVGNPTTDADHDYTTTKLTAKNIARFRFGGLEHELRAGAEIIRKDKLEAASSPGGSDDRFALFLVDEVSFGNGLTLTPALRYERQKIDGTAYGYGSYDNDALMGGLSARYEWANGFSVFGSAAYTESLPILDDLTNTRFSWGDRVINYMTTTEKARTWEIGAAYLSAGVLRAGDALSVKANLYHTDTWDVTSESGVNGITLKGLELEAAYSLSNGIYGELSANLVDARQRSTTTGAWDDFYKLAPTDTLRLVAGKRWGEELDVSWEMIAARRYDKGDVTTPVGGYGLHNLRATYRPQSGALQGTELRLGVDNVFDRSYRARLATRKAEGRNVKVSIVKTF